MSGYSCDACQLSVYPLAQLPIAAWKCSDIGSKGYKLPVVVSLHSYVRTCLHCWLLLGRGQETAGWGLPLFLLLLHLLEDGAVGKPFWVLPGGYLGVGGPGQWEGQAVGGAWNRKARTSRAGLLTRHYLQ